MPMLLAPDEIAHMDYAFALYDAGKPFVVHGATPRTLVTPEMRYLATALNYRKLRYSTLSRVPPDYGTTSYERRLDDAAPKPLHRTPPDGSPMPYVMFSYPIAYYALVATAMFATGAVDGNSLTSVYFAARLVNVVLLAVTLGFAYATFRAYRLDARTSSFATLGLGAFPLVSWVAGYAQPDNLTAALVAAAIWLFATYRRRGFDLAGAVWLCFALSALFFTKQHFAVAAYAATVPAAITRLRSSHLVKRIALATMLIALPVTAAILSFHISPVAGLADASGYAHSIAGGQEIESVSRAKALAERFAAGIRDAYFDGTGFESFWFRFGVRGTAIFPPPVIAILTPMFQFITIVAVIAFLLESSWFAHRMAYVAQRRSALTAGRLLFANVPVIVYAITTFVLLLIYAMTAGGLALQGRYWLPVMVPLILIILTVIPRAISPKTRRIITRAFALGFALYSVCAGGFAIAAINAQYYAIPSLHDPVNSLSDVETLQTRTRTIDSLEGVIVISPGDVVLRGYDVDSRTGLPARGIVATIDGITRVPGVAGIARPGIASTFHDDALARAGFEIHIPSAQLPQGEHTIRFALTDPRIGHEIHIARVLRIAVRP